MQHARQNYIVGELRLTRALLARVHLAKGFADDFQRLSVLAVLLTAVPVLTHIRR
jgi:hypothetical protein